MGSTDPEVDGFFEEKKRVRNPLVPVGALITAGVLTAGLISFKRGNSHLSQLLMRARVIAQGGTVAIMVGTAHYYGELDPMMNKLNKLMFGPSSGDNE